MTQIDSLPIDGMKHSDFEQLQSIFYYFQDQEIYYGRKDYWDKRMERLENWLEDAVGHTKDCRIKDNK